MEVTLSAGKRDDHIGKLNGRRGCRRREEKNEETIKEKDNAKVEVEKQDEAQAEEKDDVMEEGWKGSGEMIQACRQPRSRCLWGTARERGGRKREGGKDEGWAGRLD